MRKSLKLVLIPAQLHYCWISARAIMDMILEMFFSKHIVDSLQSNDGVSHFKKPNRKTKLSENTNSLRLLFVLRKTQWVSCWWSKNCVWQVVLKVLPERWLCQCNNGDNYTTWVLVIYLQLLFNFRCFRVSDSELTRAIQGGSVAGGCRLLWLLDSVCWLPFRCGDFRGNCAVQSNKRCWWLFVAF